ncbi:DUF5333 domain-containing protein [Sulfitobacter guttiformis]|uniref:DUF5333 domain-containing protein n=1 Tax=Sulfitobacter guttiformis TaxID=74349 RepID=A0A420DND9_9RHOB|nr:DUF5333 domain-containing protein [Sulfitobacter guttiformis]KIN72992.1 hypothetical protein Z949_2174 [Sulfitobacter guttiformis KCTC 32187]RKE95679.1 hypothetical protein C8N30_0216 [Sulfitobacter guttiformis]
MRHFILTVSLIALSTGAAIAKPPLRDVARIDNAVFDVAVADQIRKKCPQMAPRLITALSLYRETRKLARELGYSNDEIEAYADSDMEKARMRAKGEAYMRANGVVISDPQSYCALGRKEIQKASRIGSMLREK